MYLLFSLEDFMNWYKNLYLGKTVKGKERRIRWKVEHGKFVYGVYLILDSCKKGSLMKIVPAAVLVQPAYPREDLCVLGIAGSRSEAENLIIKMIEDIYEDTGSFEFHEYMS